MSRFSIEEMADECRHQAAGLAEEFKAGAYEDDTASEKLRTPAVRAA